jgi:porphyrinogen peroxidase
VAGFRPELWREVAGPDRAPAGVEVFNRDVVGPDGYSMPATHDAVLWLSGIAYDVVFDIARDAIGVLAGLSAVAEETSSWPYCHDRDVTDFIDCSENPSLIDAPKPVQGAWPDSELSPTIGVRGRIGVDCLHQVEDLV